PGGRLTIAPYAALAATLGAFLVCIWLLHCLGRPWLVDAHIVEKSPPVACLVVAGLLSLLAAPAAAWIGERLPAVQILFANAALALLIVQAAILQTAGL